MKKIISIIVIATIFISLVPQKLAYATAVIHDWDLTLYEGDSYTIKITGAKDIIKWSSSDKTVAIVSSKGKVKAIKVGRAKITADVGGKKLYCSVYVRGTKKEKEAAQNISYEYYKTNQSFILVLTNNNKFDISLTPTISYYDDNEDYISSEQSFFWYVEAGKKVMASYSLPKDDNDVYIESYEAKVDIDVHLDKLEDVKSYVDEISVTYNKKSQEPTTKFTNTTNTKISDIYAYAIFYNKGEIVGYNSYNIVSLPAKKSKEIQFELPFDTNFDDISFDEYKVFLNEALVYLY